eukprot:TRINITY_DN8326_c0_g1_i1.p1 TRINITY_DN8326_c0_g1~~TRINITY_DN8326_c0_g1_i1.p1  ORF type:complete len:189 (+),score=28.78 TRINITY_DN8326_c0_g1_i1:15-581(+)
MFVVWCLCLWLWLCLGEGASVGLPSLVQQFTANASVYTPDSQEPSVSVWKWDYPNLKARVDLYSPLLGLTKVKLWRYDEDFEFDVGFIFGSPVSCSQNALLDPMAPWSIPSTSVYKGTTIFKNEEVAIWAYSTGGVDTVDYITLTPPIVILQSNSSSAGTPLSQTTYIYGSFSPLPSSAFDLDPSWSC